MDQVSIVGSSSKLGDRSKGPPVRVVKRSVDGSGVPSSARPVLYGGKSVENANRVMGTGHIDLSINSVPLARPGQSRPNSGLASTTVGEVGSLQPNTAISNIQTNARQKVHNTQYHTNNHTNSTTTSLGSTRSRPSSHSNMNSSNVTGMKKQHIPVSAISRIKVKKQETDYVEEMDVWMRKESINHESRIPIPKKSTSSNMNQVNARNNNSSLVLKHMNNDNIEKPSSDNEEEYDNNTDNNHADEEDPREPQVMIVQAVLATDHTIIPRKLTGLQRLATNRPYSAREISDMIDGHRVQAVPTNITNYSDSEEEEVLLREQADYFRDADEEDSQDGQNVDEDDHIDGISSPQNQKREFIPEDSENVRIIQRVATGQRHIVPQEQRLEEEQVVLSDEENDYNITSNDKQDQNRVICLPEDLLVSNHILNNNIGKNEQEDDSVSNPIVDLNAMMDDSAATVVPMKLKLNRPSSSRAQLVLSTVATNNKTDPEEALVKRSMKSMLPSVVAKTLVATEILTISGLRKHDDIVQFEGKRLKLTHIPAALRTCSKLESLDLSGNAISTEYEDDATSVQGTGLLLNSKLCNELFLSMQRLTVLNLANNRVRDASFLTFLPNITSVNLNGNLLTHVPNLVMCSKLQQLRMAHNAIVTVGCTCTVPSMIDIPKQPCSEHKTRNTDYTSPFPMSLTTLDLSHNCLTLSSMHTQALEGMVRLEVLHLSSNNLTSKSTLENQPASKVTAVQALKAVKPKPMKPKCFLDAKQPALADLDLSYNQYTVPSPLPQAVGLQTLSLNNNHLGTIRGLKYTNLQELYISYNKIDTIGVLLEPIVQPPVKQDTKTAAVQASLQVLTAAVPCVSMLEVLDASNNTLQSIQDVAKLAGLSKLWEISLSDNPVCMEYTEEMYVREISKIQPQIEVLDEVQLLREKGPAIKDHADTVILDGEEEDDDYKELLGMIRQEHDIHELAPARNVVDLTDLGDQFKQGKNQLGEMKKTLLDGLQENKKNEDAHDIDNTGISKNDKKNHTRSILDSYHPIPNHKRSAAESRSSLLQGLSSIPQEVRDKRSDLSTNVTPSITNNNKDNAILRILTNKKSLLTADSNYERKEEHNDDEDMLLIRQKRLEALAKVADIPHMGAKQASYKTPKVSNGKKSSNNTNVDNTTNNTITNTNNNNNNNTSNTTNNHNTPKNLVQNLLKDLASENLADSLDSIDDTSDVEEALPLYAKLHPPRSETPIPQRSETPVNTITNAHNPLIQRLQRPSSALRKATESKGLTAEQSDPPTKAPNVLLSQPTFKLGRKK